MPAKEPTLPVPRVEATMPELDEVKFVKSRKPEFKAGPPPNISAPSKAFVRKYPTIPGTKASSIIKSVP